jgi:hypothetical protein
MKKYFTGILIVFGVVTVLALLSNLIRWDETPLEHTIFVFPLVIGSVLQIPLLAVLRKIVGGNHSSFIFLSYWLIPCITGLCYSGLYYIGMLGRDRLLRSDVAKK